MAIVKLAPCHSRTSLSPHKTDLEFHHLLFSTSERRIIIRNLIEPICFSGLVAYKILRSNVLVAAGQVRLDL